MFNRKYIFKPQWVDFGNGLIMGSIWAILFQTQNLGFFAFCGKTRTGVVGLALWNYLRNVVKFRVKGSNEKINSSAPFQSKNQLRLR